MNIIIWVELINRVSKSTNLGMIGVITDFIWDIPGSIDEIGPSIVSSVDFIKSKVVENVFIILKGIPAPGGYEVGTGSVLRRVITPLSGVIVVDKVSDN